MKRKILKMLTAFSFAAVLTTSFSAVGVANAKNEQSDEISCAAKSAYVLDFDTGTVVYAKNENEKLPIASMTKIMTASIILDDVKAGKLSLSDPGWRYPRQGSSGRRRRGSAPGQGRQWTWQMLRRSQTSSCR